MVTLTVGRDEPSADLRALAEAHGVVVTYLDHGGIERTAGADALVAVLESLGVDDAGHDPAGALASHEAAASERLVEPVVVLGDGVREGTSVALASVPLRARGVEFELTCEDGSVVTWAASWTDEAPGELGIEIPGDVPPGYHLLRVAAGPRESVAHVLKRPPGGARGRLDDAWRGVGVSAPLFTLHSSRSWGCGDLADLDALAGIASEHGTAVVSTLPLLAGFGPDEFEPSPYVPLSRLFWHDRWLDVDAAVMALGSAGAAALAHTAAARTRTRAAAAHPYVDGETDLREKRAVLEGVLAELGTRGSSGRTALDAFVRDRPAVTDYAHFRAAGERLGVEWPTWPAAMRHGRIEPRDVDPVAAEYHAFAQWLCDEQLRALAARFAQRGQVLSLDLPLGIHPLGFDAWRHRGQYLEGLSVGAPPDRFFPEGQVWGFPPPRLAAARADGHALFRQAIVHHLNVAGMLRIDHVLGTKRLFCIPIGAEASDGVYVRMPLEELLAVVAIEAQRHRATVVGEDLGTVDTAVRRAMQRDGVRRTSVVELAIRSAGSAPFVPPPNGAVASFSTHDLATFEGWWRARDVDERLALGQVDAAAGAAMHDARRAERARLATLVGADGTGEAPPAGLYDATLDLLATSDAGVVLVQLDDVLGELDAVNLPGTADERRNWQRRTALPLEAVATDARLAHALDRTRAGRAARATSRAVQTTFGVSRLTGEDEARFAAGTHARLHECLGAHPMTVDGDAGTYFAVWAPNAAWVEVVGDFNAWDGHRHPLARRPSGIWEGFVADVGAGERYKFRLESTLGGDVLDKADPFAAWCEPAPRTASIIHSPAHAWRDETWLASRGRRQAPSAPISIYEVHLGSWRRDPDDPGRFLTYRELAPQLATYAGEHGFTHIELLPVMAHPLYESWGYQLTGYYAPTPRYGEPDEFAAMVDELHRSGIGVILDWAPAHFPSDAFALARFDGTHLYEHPDPRMRVHPDWSSLLFDYDRGEVRSFLISSACAWLDRYHADGLRVDAVASMLYLDYSRAEGEWVPNEHGGNENLAAVELLRTCNDAVHREHPGTITIAEESTTWPGVTAPTTEGGLGFDYKWDLGWMHDTLGYLHADAVGRRARHNELTFRSLYLASEQYVLPLSHDEVVHGKGSLYAQMAGEGWQRMANLRLLFGYQLLQPGKKLLFMGDELGQPDEWAEGRGLEWSLLGDPVHAGLAALVAHLNELYATVPALHRDDLADRGFAWIEADDREHRVVCAERHDGDGGYVVIACNGSDRPIEGYSIGLPAGGTWALRCNSDETRFGGRGHAVASTLAAEAVGSEPRPWRAGLSIPPLGFVIYSQR